MRTVIKGQTVVLQGYLGSSREGADAGFAVRRPDGTFYTSRTTTGVVDRGDGFFEFTWQAPSVSSTELDLVYEFDDGLAEPQKRSAWDTLALTVPGLSAPIETVEFAYSTQLINSDGGYSVVVIRPYDRFGLPVSISYNYGATVSLVSQVGPGVWTLDPLKVSSNNSGEMITILRPPSGDFGNLNEQKIKVKVTIPGFGDWTSDFIVFDQPDGPVSPDEDIYADIIESDPIPGNIRYRKTELHVQISLQTFDTQHRPLPGAFVEWFVDNPAWSVPQAIRYSDYKGELVAVFPIPSDRSGARITARSGNVVLTWLASQTR